MKATTAGTLGPAGSQATPYCTRTPWPSLLARGNLGQEASNHTALPRRRWCGSEVPGGCTAAPSATCHAPDWGSSASQRSPAHRDHSGPSMEVAPPVQRVLCRPRRPALGGLAWGWGLKPQGSTAGPTPNGTASLESNPPGSSNLCLPGWDVAPVQVPQGTLERALLISESHRLWAEGFCPRMDSTQNLTHTRVR